MLSLPQLKSLVAGNAVLSAAAKAGDLKLVYPKSSTISEDRLYGVWTLEILLVESDSAELIEGALRRGGFEHRRTKTGWIASYSFALTPADRAKLEKKDKEDTDKAEAVKLKKKDSEIQAAIAEIRAELAEVKEDVDLVGLLRPKAGQPGPQGPRGPMGPPGRDATAQDISLQDLADVSDGTPKQGQVVMYQEATNSWELRFPPMSGGGGGGGGLRPPSNDGKIYGMKDGLWVELEPDHEHESCTDGGDACDHDPQTSGVDGADACLVDPHSTELDAGFGCNACLDDIDNDGGIALTVQQRDREDLAAAPTNVIQNVSTISFDTDSGFVVEDLGNGTQEAFVKINSTFNPWHVDGQTTLDATGEEPVEFVAGPGITITTDETASPKQIIFESTAAGGDGYLGEAPQDGKQYVRENGAWVAAPDYSTEIAALQAENTTQQAQIANLTNLLIDLQAQVDSLSGGSGGGGVECGVLLEECSDALTLFTFEDGVDMTFEDGVTRVETEDILD